MTEAEQIRYLSTATLSPPTWRTYLNQCWDAAILENALRSLKEAAFVLDTMLNMAALRRETKEQIHKYQYWWIQPAIEQLTKIVEEE